MKLIKRSLFVGPENHICTQLDALTQLTETRYTAAFIRFLMSLDLTHLSSV